MKKFLIVVALMEVASPQGAALLLWIVKVDPPGPARRVSAAQP